MLPTNLPSESLLQFRAGKMTYEDGLVTADPNPSYLTFMQKDAQTVEILWTSKDDKTSFLLPKNKTTLKKVDACTTGRVFLLEVSSCDVESEPVRHFFWFQERFSTKDAEYMDAMQRLFDPAQVSQLQLKDFKKILADIHVANTTSQNINFVDLFRTTALTKALNSDPQFYFSKIKEFLPFPNTDSSRLLEEVKSPFLQAQASAIDGALANPSTYKLYCDLFNLTGTQGNGNAVLFLDAFIKQYGPKK
ncbi:hypothetical protein STCU_01959 [Strigomonas culicis]|uniref:Pru domain-containing protein n=1 Tax=Strigomonas culicis TaxID=28005 RepID=S9UXV8_9TRYP|nr:hypothetical protein STCU_04319 [Strigomonas culicis]EPY33668.1 hypothetical protein STCU_02098 [Strigomonas culicis]EPY33807.1 hypothetical protein STCU_01959 [Strigomonas culicis]|eukprot:EPY29933.1 hypothetical protein STCU_04319 [Strigomonas culicis]